MPRYQVVAEFIDSLSGVRLMPGDFVEATGSRVDELKNAGVVGAEISIAPASFSVSYLDDSEKTITEQVEAGSYQEAVGKVINSLFVQPEVSENEVPQITKKPLAKPKNARK